MTEYSRFDIRQFVTGKTAKRFVLYLSVVAILVLFAFPLYWMFVSSIKPMSEIMSYPPALVPNELTLENYLQLIEDTDYLVWLQNSLIVSIGNVLLSVTLSVMAGYGLTRYDFPYKSVFAYSFLIGYMFAPMMLGVPYYMLFYRFGLLDTYPGLILAHASITVPFTIWLMWQFFQTVPIDWEEAAWICGASRYKAMLEIAIPGAIPGIIASAIFAFAISWNDYTFALVIMSSPSKQMLTTGVAQFMSGTQVYWHYLMTGASLLIIPPLLIVFFLNKYILEGFSMGGFD